MGTMKKLTMTLLQDLATMVHEQGDIVDSIESNIESTSVQVTTGTEQLRQVGNLTAWVRFSIHKFLLTGLSVPE